MTGVKTYHIKGEATIWRIFITPPGGQTVDITKFRGAPTMIGNLTYVDPFGDGTATLTLPAITGLDRPGYGDLEWLVPNANVDVVEYDARTGIPTGMNWEGFYVSEDQEEAGLTLQCQGALFQLDSFQAKPTYPTQPLPYELVIKDAFDPLTHPSLRTAPLRIEWPEDWSTIVPDHPDDMPAYMRPWGVKVGQKWTGLTTRTTGSWEPTLTGLVQTLLGMMHTPEGGQWTIRKDTGRVPVLYVRKPVFVQEEGMLEVWYGVHGVKVSLSRDYSQSANVVYASGTDLAGSTFSGMRVTGDGATTYYEPFSASPYVYPDTDTNPNLIRAIPRKEIHISLPQGVDEIGGREIAYAHLRKVNDPGYTGTISLSIDPMKDGEPFSRMRIKAGQPIVLHGFRGSNIILHITKSDIDIENQTVNLTVDSKFRDSLTVQEVQARTRDALDPVRLLQVGRYSNTVQDLIKPWSYNDGSGVFPMGAKEFFKTAPANEQFPWVNWTRKYPPKDYPHYYAMIPARSSNANENWALTKRGDVNSAGYAMYLAQAGSIRLSQVAAYDEHGNVLPIRFHFGIYNNRGIGTSAMPKIPAGGYDGYKAGQAYPFFPGAFESVREDGTEQENPNYLISGGAEQIIAWGNYYEPAGYSPGMASRGAKPTGMLVDETQWAFDTTNTGEFNKYSVEQTRKWNEAGVVFCMIYADDQGDKPVYFLGRFWRVEPIS